MDGIQNLQEQVEPTAKWAHVIGVKPHRSEGRLWGLERVGVRLEGDMGYGEAFLDD